MRRNKIVCVKADQRLNDLWETAVRKCSTDVDPVFLEKQCDTVIDLFGQLTDLLEESGDRVVYSLPVNVVHSLEFLDRLDEFDFVGFKEAGLPAINLGFFAATKSGLERILEASKTYEFDEKSGVDQNATMMILNALGNKAEFKLNKNDFVSALGPMCNERGHVCTFCGPPAVMELARESRLNVTDVVENLMMNAIEGNKEVQYRDK